MKKNTILTHSSKIMPENLSSLFQQRDVILDPTEYVFSNFLKSRISVDFKIDQSNRNQRFGQRSLVSIGSEYILTNVNLRQGNVPTFSTISEVVEFYSERENYELINTNEAFQSNHYFFRSQYFQLNQDYTLLGDRNIFFNDFDSILYACMFNQDLVSDFSVPKDLVWVTLQSKDIVTSSSFSFVNYYITEFKDKSKYSINYDSFPRLNTLSFDSMLKIVSDNFGKSLYKVTSSDGKNHFFVGLSAHKSQSSVQPNSGFVRYNAQPDSASQLVKRLYNIDINQRDQYSDEFLIYIGQTATPWNDLSKASFKAIFLEDRLSDTYVGKKLNQSVWNQDVTKGTNNYPIYSTHPILKHFRYLPKFSDQDISLYNKQNSQPQYLSGKNSWAVPIVKNIFHPSDYFRQSVPNKDIVTKILDGQPYNNNDIDNLIIDTCFFSKTLRSLSDDHSSYIVQFEKYLGEFRYGWLPESVSFFPWYKKILDLMIDRVESVIAIDEDHLYKFNTGLPSTLTEHYTIPQTSKELLSTLRKLSELVTFISPPDSFSILMDTEELEFSPGEDILSEFNDKTMVAINEFANNSMSPEFLFSPILNYAQTDDKRTFFLDLIKDNSNNQNIESLYSTWKEIMDLRYAIAVKSISEHINSIFELCPSNIMSSLLDIDDTGRSPSTTVNLSKWTEEDFNAGMSALVNVFEGLKNYPSSYNGNDSIQSDIDDLYDDIIISSLDVPGWSQDFFGAASRSLRIIKYKIDLIDQLNDDGAKKKIDKILNGLGLNIDIKDLFNYDSIINLLKSAVTKVGSTIYNSIDFISNVKSIEALSQYPAITNKKVKYFRVSDDVYVFKLLIPKYISDILKPEDFDYDIRKFVYRSDQDDSYYINMRTNKDNLGLVTKILLSKSDSLTKFFSVLQLSSNMNWVPSLSNELKIGLAGLMALSATISGGIAAAASTGILSRLVAGGVVAATLLGVNGDSLRSWSSSSDSQLTQKELILRNIFSSLDTEGRMSVAVFDPNSHTEWTQKSASMVHDIRDVLFAQHDKVFPTPEYPSFFKNCYFENVREAFSSSNISNIRLLLSDEYGIFLPMSKLLQISKLSTNTISVGVKIGTSAVLASAIGSTLGKIRNSIRLSNEVRRGRKANKDIHVGDDGKIYKMTRDEYRRKVQFNNFVADNSKNISSISDLGKLKNLMTPVTSSLLAVSSGAAILKKLPLRRNKEGLNDSYPNTDQISNIDSKLDELLSRDNKKAENAIY